MTSASCCIFLGLLFVVSAFLKLSDIQNFKEYLDQYPWLKSDNHNRAYLAVTCEFLLGLALLVTWQRNIVLPLAMFTIFLLSLLTLTGLMRYNIQTCGCYGRYMRLTPQQSIKLNVAYFLIACIGFLTCP